MDEYYDNENNHCRGHNFVHFMLTELRIIFKFTHSIAIRYYDFITFFMIFNILALWLTDSKQSPCTIVVPKAFLFMKTWSQPAHEWCRWKNLFFSCFISVGVFHSLFLSNCLQMRWEPHSTEGYLVQMVFEISKERFAKLSVLGLHRAWCSRAKEFCWCRIRIDRSLEFGVATQ